MGEGKPVTADRPGVLPEQVELEISRAHHDIRDCKAYEDLDARLRRIALAAQQAAYRKAAEIARKYMDCHRRNRSIEIAAELDRLAKGE